MAAQTYAKQRDVPVEPIREPFLVEMGHITPKVGSNAAIFNQQSVILLMERSNGTDWCLPCDWRSGLFQALKNCSVKWRICARM